MINETLITGGDGYLGKLLTTTLLNSTDKNIALWVRVADSDELQAKKQCLETLYEKHAGRVSLYYSDLREEQPFSGVPTKNINEIIHTAAITRFNVEENLAALVNREGSRKAMEFARRCNKLQRFSYISTVYSSGLKEGVVNEAYVDPANQFCNFYEKSKCEAEHLLHTEYDDLPWTIFRPATMIADNDSGQVSQYNVFHNTMRLLFYGLISLIPGHKDTPVYLTTGTYTADAIYKTSYSDADMLHKIYNVCHSKGEAISLGELIDRVYLSFQKDPGFTKRRILKPLFTNMQAFESLASSLKGLGGAVVREALDSIRPFSKQLFITKDIRNDNLASAWPDHPPMNIQTLTDNVASYLVSTRWGNVAS